ncbi:MAG: hypothetical protein WA884_10830, partial [Methyloceanibacter sp.]
QRPQARCDWGYRLPKIHNICPGFKRIGLADIVSGSFQRRDDFVRDICTAGALERARQPPGNRRMTSIEKPAKQISDIA